MKYPFGLILGLCFFCACKESADKKESLQQQQQEKVREKLVFTDTMAALFAEIAYCPEPQQQLDKYLTGWKVVWNPLGIKGNHAFVATNDEVYVVAVRGSLISFSEDAFNNWIYNDLNVAVQDKWPYCSAAKANISQGSFIGWQNLESMKDRNTGVTLWGYLSQHVKPDNPLYLTGHSLGGNLAMVYASFLSWKFNESGRAKDNINVTTFAAPAPGNSYFAEDFDTMFPHAVRIENTNDIVPKFPCSASIRKLASLYSSQLSADSVMIGYKNIRTSLSNAFLTIGKLLDLAEITTSFSGYKHTSGSGKLITIPLSGKNTGSGPETWFAEAGYQHGMAQYAAALGAPIIDCK